MPSALEATYYGANGWLLSFDGLRVLVDPWLTGPLQFPPGPWFFQGHLPHPWAVPARLDLLLLSQGLCRLYIGQYRDAMRGFAWGSALSQRISPCPTGFPSWHMIDTSGIVTHGNGRREPG